MNSPECPEAQPSGPAKVAHCCSHTTESGWTANQNFIRISVLMTSSGGYEKVYYSYIEIFGREQAVPKNLGKKRKETGLEFYRGYGVGLGWGFLRVVWTSHRNQMKKHLGFCVRWLRSGAEGSRKCGAQNCSKRQKMEPDFYIIAALSTPLLEYYAKDVVMWVFFPLMICLTWFLVTKPNTRVKLQPNQVLNLLKKESNFSLKELQALDNTYLKEQGKRAWT